MKTSDSEMIDMMDNLEKGVITNKEFDLFLKTGKIPIIWNPHFDMVPSKTTDLTWIRVIANPDEYKMPSTKSDSGKWLIFSDLDKIDFLWDKIKKATSFGLLGRSSKCTTSKTGDIKKVICVYTYSFSDNKDVMRIRDELTKIGVTWKIPYKLDSKVGTYKKDGNTKISSLYF